MARSDVPLVASILLLGEIIAAPALAQSPQATPPYVLTVFATAPAGLSAPDSIAVLDQHVFVGYGDGHQPDGSDHLNSQVVEYAPDGSIVHVYTVPGHNDGLKVDPIDHHLWALQNEDSNPNLVIIDPVSRQQQSYKFGPTPHGGGYDDIVFRGCKVYISASNPAKNPNTGPAIVTATLGDGIVKRLAGAPRQRQCDRHPNRRGCPAESEGSRFDDARSPRQYCPRQPGRSGIDHGQQSW
jgi:hypothetical protein